MIHSSLLPSWKESIAGEWPWIPLEELCDLIVDCPHSTPEYVDWSGYLCARTHDFATGSLQIQNVGHVSKETYEERTARAVPCYGDLIYSREGSIHGIAAQIPRDAKICLGQRTVLIRPSPDRANHLYILYWLNSNQVRSYVDGHKTGSAAPRINLPTIRALPVAVPPLSVQHAIGSVLGTLDEKIELIHRMNETLEALAKALFKSWFIDFDPVRAKIAGRAPIGMDAATAALFPTAMDGERPAGWADASIYEAAAVTYGAPFASALFNTQRRGKPLVRIRDLKDEEPQVWTTEQHSKGVLIEPGDILVGMDGEFRAHVWGGDEAWLNQRVCLFKPRPGFCTAFVQHAIVAPLALVEATETATTVIHLGKSDIDKFKFVMPTRQVLDAFKRSAQPWLDLIVSNKRESRTLAQLRDLLLPRLLSGELRIRDAEREVGKVA